MSVSVHASGRGNPWIIGICSVLFDIDKGQTLQHLYPPDCVNDDEQASVAFHAFPDSLSLELYTRNAIKDSSFQFRIKRKPESNQTAEQSFSYLHGYVFCRQRQDESLRRGSEQSAVVVMSELPLSSVLLPLSQAVGHAYFSDGAVALEQTYNQIQIWPAPVPGSSMCLTVGPVAAATVVQARIPHYCLLPQPQPEVDPEVYKASIARKVSRTISLKRGLSTSSSSTSSKLAAAAAAAVTNTQQQQQQQQENTPVTASAAQGTNGWCVVENSSSSMNNIKNDYSKNDSISSKQDVTENDGSSGASTAAAAAAAPSDVSSSSDCPFWVAAALGQQWQMEAPFPEVDIAAVLSPLLRHLWTLWQLLITGQPLMVVGLTPRDTSIAIQALLSLISPLPYAADYRPYFTIHDPDFIHISRGKLPSRSQYQEPNASSAIKTAAAAANADQAMEQHLNNNSDDNVPAAAAVHDQQQGPDLPALLGVTNLYFIKALPNFPSVVAVSKKEQAAHNRSNSWGGSSNGSSNQLDALSPQLSSPSSPAAAAAAAETPTAAAAAAAATPQPAAPRRGLLSSTAAAAVRALKRRHNGPQNLLYDFSHHLWCGSKPLVRPDHQLISAVTAVMQKEAAAAAAGGGSAHRQLKRHFAELTAAFLKPFDKYLIPGQNGKVPRWCPDKFLSSLTSQPSSLLPPVLTARLSSSSAAAALYGAFLDSHNFCSWFGHQRQRVMHLLEDDEDHDDDDQQQQQQQEEEKVEEMHAFEQQQQHEPAAQEIASSDAAAAAVAAAAPLSVFDAVTAAAAADPDEISLVQAVLSAEQDLLAANAQCKQQQQQQQQQSVVGPGEALLLPAALQQQQHWQQCDDAVEQQLGLLSLQIKFVTSLLALPRDLQEALVSSPNRKQLLEKCMAAIENSSRSSSGVGAVGSVDVAALQQLQQLLQNMNV